LLASSAPDELDLGVEVFEHAIDIAALGLTCTDICPVGTARPRSSRLRPTLESMPVTLLETSLAPRERAAVEAVARALEDDLGGQLASIWLYGSAARGEAAGEDSDIDLMIVVDGGRREHWRRVWEVIERVAPEHEADPIRFSPHVVDPGWVEGRREIESFFMQEVDRDKIVISGAV
jgi:predicted nucleotidyltransferase